MSFCIVVMDSLQLSDIKFRNVIHICFISLPPPRALKLSEYLECRRRSSIVALGGTFTQATNLTCGLFFERCSAICVCRPPSLRNRAAVSGRCQIANKSCVTASTHFVVRHTRILFITAQTNNTLTFFFFSHAVAFSLLRVTVFTTSNAQHIYLLYPLLFLSVTILDKAYLSGQKWDIDMQTADISICFITHL